MRTLASIDCTRSSVSVVITLHCHLFQLIQAVTLNDGIHLLVSRATFSPFVFRFFFLFPAWNCYKIAFLLPTPYFSTEHKSLAGQRKCGLLFCTVDLLRMKPYFIFTTIIIRLSFLSSLEVAMTLFYESLQHYRLLCPLCVAQTQLVRFVVILLCNSCTTVVQQTRNISTKQSNDVQSHAGSSSTRPL